MPERANIWIVEAKLLTVLKYLWLFAFNWINGFRKNLIIMLLQCNFSQFCEKMKLIGHLKKFLFSVKVGHFEWKAGLQDIILKGNHLRTITAKLFSNWPCHFKPDIWVVFADLCLIFIYDKNLQKFKVTTKPIIYESVDSKQLWCIRCAFQQVMSLNAKTSESQNCNQKS